MELGAFSVSLAVEDLAVSRAFYEELGFVALGGDEAQGWLILGNGETKLGLFCGHIPKNTLTFNPGWSQNAEELETFTDVRELAKALRARGIELDADTTTDSDAGPAYIMLRDPDGNPILIDQYR